MIKYELKDLWWLLMVAAGNIGMYVANADVKHFLIMDMMLIFTMIGVGIMNHKYSELLKSKQ